MGNNSGDIITKRMTIPSQVIASAAGGSIAVKSYVSGLVQSTPASEWASFAARYQQYRVRRFRVVGKATHPTVDIVATSHSALYIGDYIGSATPASAAQVLSDESVKENATWQNFSYEATWARNPNAKLWNPTSAVIPTANEYSVVLASADSTLAAAVTYYSAFIEFEVEFRGSQ
jgi:hypothetical protein